MFYNRRIVNFEGDVMKTAMTELFGIHSPDAARHELDINSGTGGGGEQCRWTGYSRQWPVKSQQTREAIARIPELTDKPFGIGVTLLMPGADDNAKVALQEKVR